MLRNRVNREKVTRKSISGCLRSRHYLFITQNASANKIKTHIFVLQASQYYFQSARELLTVVWLAISYIYQQRGYITGMGAYSKGKIEY